MTTIMNSQAQMGLANSERAAKDLQDKTRNIDTLQRSLIPQVDKEKKLKEACQGFETIFVKKMWEEMQSTVQESDFLKSRDEKHWRSMYNQELAETLTEAGGIGLADMMYKQLSGNLANASRATIATSFNNQPAGFEIKPVPLMNLSDIGQKQIANNSANINDQILANKQMANNSANLNLNDKSMYSAADNQPIAPNLDQIHNQSIQNAHDAISNMNAKDLNTGNSKVIQDVLEQLKAQKINYNAQGTNDKVSSVAQSKSALQGQQNITNSMYTANINTVNINDKQQNHILQQNPSTQPSRNNAYTAPIVNNLSNGAILPNNNAVTNRAPLPKQSSINQTQVHGQPGISPSQYINNSPFVVKAPINNVQQNNNVGRANTAQNVPQNTAQNNIPAQNYIPAQVQNKQIEQALIRQDLTVLPSKRKVNII